MLSTQPSGFRYFIELAYHGGPFSGWQVQPGELTVQQTLNHALQTLLREPVNVVGCGRTDTGVHASHFVAHMDLQACEFSCIDLAHKLNRFINLPVRIDRIEQVSMDTHARFDACGRTYHYLLSRRKEIFMRDFSWNYTIPLDIERMNSAARMILGNRDFTSFSKLHTDVKTNYCEIREAEWTDLGDWVVFRVSANRFLRNMVRAMVGTMIEVGKGRIPAQGILEVLDARNRSDAGMSVPPQGLFLSRVDYPAEKFRVNPSDPFDRWIYSTGQ